jgi:acyl-CoA synthetase (NDP forming)
MTNVAENSWRMLPEPEAAELLASCGIPYVVHGVAGTADEAAGVAGRIGYPVVLKVVSPDIVHKTEAGGVLLGLKDEPALREGYDELLRRVRASCPEARIEGVLVGRHVAARRELIVGAIHDATFGPTVMVGLGGVFAEALSDVVFRLAPMRRQDGLDMLQELQGTRLLAGFRGERPVDVDELADILVRIGDLLVAHPEFSEIDLNPVAASADGCVALDARVIMTD